MSPVTPNSEQELLNRYLSLVNAANDAVAAGDTAARIAAEREITKVGTQLDALRASQR